MNENSLENASHEKAVNYIKTANDRIVLVVQSLERTVREVCILLSGRTDCLIPRGLVSRLTRLVWASLQQTNPMVLQKKVPPPVTPSKTPEVEYIQDGKPKV